MLTTAARGINSNRKLEARVYDKEGIGFIWPEIEPILERSVEVSKGMIGMDSLESMLAKDEATAFVLLENGRVQAVLVARVIPYNTYNAARIIACAGIDLAGAMEYWDVLESWALLRDCSEIEGWCNPSMARLVGRFGFKTKKHIVTRDLRSKLQ